MMNSRLPVALLLAASAALASSARAVDDMYMTGAFADAFQSAAQQTKAQKILARPPKAEAPRNSDNRIVDGGAAFADSNYPDSPVALITYWGVKGAKIDEDVRQDQLCSDDLGKMRDEIDRGLARLGGARNDAGAAKTFLSPVNEVCSDPGEGGQPGGRHAQSCLDYTVRHCAMILSSNSKYRFQYVRGQLRASVLDAKADVRAASVRAPVLDSDVIAVFDHAAGEMRYSARTLELVDPSKASSSAPAPAERSDPRE